MPLISVVVPVYNMEKFLPICIESILRQSIQDIEVILVDDGSTDTSGSICDAYSKQDSRVKVIHKENGGVSAARNDGMRRATGEYLAFVDSDDCVDEKLYETLINAMTEKDAELAVCSCIRIDEEGNMLPEDNWCCILPNLIESGVEIINMKGIPEVAQWVTVTAWNRLCKRSFYEDLRWEEGKLHEDEYFFLDFYERFNKVVCLSDQLYYYRKNAVSITNTIRVSRYLNKADAMRERILKCIDKKYLDGIFFYEKSMYGALKTIYTNRMRVVNDALVNIKKYQNMTKCVYNLGKMSRWQYTKRNLMYFCMCVVFRINRRTRGK